MFSPIVVKQDIERDQTLFLIFYFSKLYLTWIFVERGLPMMPPGSSRAAKAGLSSSPKIIFNGPLPPQFKNHRVQWCLINSQISSEFHE